MSIRTALKRRESQLAVVLIHVSNMSFLRIKKRFENEDASGNSVLDMIFVWLIRLFGKLYGRTPTAITLQLHYAIYSQLKRHAMAPHKNWKWQR